MPGVLHACSQTASPQPGPSPVAGVAGVACMGHGGWWCDWCVWCDRHRGRSGWAPSSVRLMGLATARARRRVSLRVKARWLRWAVAGSEHDSPGVKSMTWSFLRALRRWLVGMPTVVVVVAVEKEEEEEEEAKQSSRRRSTSFRVAHAAVFWGQTNSFNVAPPLSNR